MQEIITPVLFPKEEQAVNASQNGMPTFPNNYGVPQGNFSQQFYEQFFLTREKQQWEFQKEQQRHVNEMETLQLKEELYKKRERAMERRKENRLLARTAVYKDIDGFLCFEMIYPDETKVYSDRILNIPEIQLTCIKDITDLKIKFAIVNWKGSKNHWLEEKNFSPKGLKKLFDSQGVAVEVGRDRKNAMISMIWDFLIKNATYIELYPHRGWCQTENGWKFADDTCITIEYLKNGGK